MKNLSGSGEREWKEWLSPIEERDLDGGKESDVQVIK